MPERQIVDDYVWEFGREDVKGFYTKYPRFFRYWVEGEYDYPESYLEPSEEDEDQTFQGYLTYFKSWPDDEDQSDKHRYSVHPDDKLENQFFEEDWSPEEVVDMIQRSRWNDYMVVQKVHKLIYNVEIETTEV